jgi:hemoglobin-like flavoprotein
VTPDQISLVRSSWPILEANADSLSTTFYAYLFSIDHGAARLFAHVDMEGQRMKLVQSLSVVVHALDDTDRLLPPLAALAKRHTRYGVELHHFHSVGEALIHALGETLGSAFTPELLRAWTDAYALITSVMQRALLRAAG